MIYPAATVSASTASSSPAHALPRWTSSSRYVQPPTQSLPIKCPDADYTRPSTELERERQRGPHDQQPADRRALPDGQLQARAASAYRDAPQHAPEPARARRRLPRGVDRLRPAAAADQRAPVSGRSCSVGRCRGAPRVWGMFGRRVPSWLLSCRLYDLLVCTLQSTGASHLVPAVYVLVCVCACGVLSFGIMDPLGGIVLRHFAHECSLV